MEEKYCYFAFKYTLIYTELDLFNKIFNSAWSRIGGFMYKNLSEGFLNTKILLNVIVTMKKDLLCVLALLFLFYKTGLYQTDWSL